MSRERKGRRKVRGKKRKKGRVEKAIGMEIKGEGNVGRRNRKTAGQEMRSKQGGYFFLKYPSEYPTHRGEKNTEEGKGKVR